MEFTLVLHRKRIPPKIDSAEAIVYREFPAANNDLAASGSCIISWCYGFYFSVPLSCVSLLKSETCNFAFRQLIEVFEQCIKFGESNSALVLGPRGSGKTKVRAILKIIKNYNILPIVEKSNIHITSHWFLLLLIKSNTFKMW